MSINKLSVEQGHKKESAVQDRKIQNLVKFERKLH